MKHLSTLVLALAACLLTFAAQPLAAQASAPAAATTTPPPADFRPARFFTHVEGNGPDVIMIPGLGSSRDVWKDEAAKLTPHYRVHLVQIRGFAGYPAGVNASGPLLQPIVTELAQYIEALHMQQPAVIGHSLGGTLGLMLAIQHPQDVGKLMVVDAVPALGLLLNPDESPQAIEDAAIHMKTQIMEEPTQQFLKDEQAYVAANVRNESARPQVIFWSVNSDRHTMTNALYEDLTLDLRPEMPKIQTPITLLYPFDSTKQQAKETDKRYAKAYAAAPHVTLVRIDDSYHFIMLDQPQKFDEAVQKFLKS